MKEQIAFATDAPARDDPSLPPDLRVDCADCGNKSAHTCLRTREPIMVGLLHYCDKFAPKRRK